MRSKINSIAFSLFAIFVLATAAISAQTPTPAPTPVIKEEDQVIKVSSRLVVVPVSVSDANGEPVPIEGETLYSKIEIADAVLGA